MHEAKRLRAKCLRVWGFEHLFRSLFRRPARRRGFGASMFEHFRFLGASERSFSSIFRLLGVSERSFSSIFRRQEASERAFSSIFDVWGLRSEHFRGFSTSGGFGASIFEVSRGEQRAICAKAPPSSREPLRKHCIDMCGAYPATAPPPQVFNEHRSRFQRASESLPDDFRDRFRLPSGPKMFKNEPKMAPKRVSDRMFDSQLIF